MEQNNYEKVLEYGESVFLNTDLSQILERTKTKLTEAGDFIKVPVIDKVYLVEVKTGKIYLEANREQEVELGTKLLISHYLIYSQNYAYEVGKEIPFHQIKGVSHFEKAFLDTTIPPLKENFEGNLEAFQKAGEKLGGKPCNHGDVSYKLQIFPTIAITYILWDGDEEFPMNIQILFDEGITTCIHPEDVPVLGTYGALALVEAAKTNK